MIVKGCNYYFNCRKELREFLDERGFHNLEIPFEKHWESESFLENWDIQYNVEVRGDKIVWCAVEFPYNHCSTPSPFFDEDRSFISKLNGIYSFSEASEKWGLDSSTLRKLVKTPKVTEGVDYKKSGKVWLVTDDCMRRIYGEPTED